MTDQTDRITIQECPMCQDAEFTMLPDELKDADGYAECDLCGYARYPEDLQDAPFSDRALDQIPDDLDLDDLADTTLQDELVKITGITLQEKLMKIMEDNGRLVDMLPPINYEVGDEGRKITIITLDEQEQSNG